MGVAEDLRAVLDRFDEEETPVVIVGGIALDILAQPRSTADVDLLVDDDAPDVGAASYAGLLIEERSRDEVFGQDVVAGHLPTRPLPFELFFAAHPFTRQAVRRRRPVESPEVGRSVPAPTVEDFLVMKAAYSRSPSRSQAKAAQDAVDLEAVIESRRDEIDWDFVEEHSRSLGCWDVLEPLR